MPTCVHKGCEKTYGEEENDDNACIYHPLPPIFHEGKVYFLSFYEYILIEYLSYSISYFIL